MMLIAARIALSALVAAMLVGTAYAATRPALTSVSHGHVVHGPTTGAPASVDN